MKRSVEALVSREVVAMAIVAIVIAALCGAARAEPVEQAAPVASPVSPVAKLQASASLRRSSTASGVGKDDVRFHVTASFSTDTPGAELFTVQKAVMFFPDHAGTAGGLFPSCGAAQIERFHGDVGRCPKGSKIGSGTVKARALQLGLTASGRVTMFNSHHGKGITFNIQTNLPAYINESIDAPLTQLHGIYGEKLTLVVPHSLQEIISGVFVGVQTFHVTLDGAVVVNGVQHTFLKARTCPKRAMHGVFDFANGMTGQTATVTADTKVHCTLG